MLINLMNNVRRCNCGSGLVFARMIDSCMRMNKLVSLIDIDIKQFVYQV